MTPPAEPVSLGDQFSPVLVNLSRLHWRGLQTIPPLPSSLARLVRQAWTFALPPSPPVVMDKAKTLVKVAQEMGQEHRTQHVLIHGALFLVPLATLQCQLNGLTVWYPFNQKGEDGLYELKYLVPAPMLFTEEE